MDKSMIPTEEFKLPVSGRVVHYYQYLTQSETDEHLRIQLGEATFNEASQTYEGVDPLNLLTGKRFMVKSLLVDLTWEQFEVLHPKDREALTEVIEATSEEPKKKK